MNGRSEPAGSEPDLQQELWLGYDGLLVPLPAISALLVYQPAWDRRIQRSYGLVPPDIQAVVLLHDGRVLPSRRALGDLRARWNVWQAAQAEQSDQVDAPDSASGDD